MTEARSRPEVDLAGIGLSTTLDAAVKMCRWRLEGRATWSRLDYLQIGVYSREEVPAELPELLRAAGLVAVVHLLELNLMRPLAPQSALLERLLPRIDRLAPVCVEEDLGLWRWGQTELEQHMLPPVFDRESLEVIADNAARVQAALGRPFLVENPPIYFDLGTIDLLSFMREVAERAGCGLVLDIGHLVGYCAATDRDPEEYLRGWTGIEQVRELHVAGYNLLPDTDSAPMWYDNHADPISDYSLDLVALARQRAGRALPITLEQEGATFARIAQHVERVAGRFAP
jgi:uncharacterized protein (UPF0276 family)